MLWFDGVELNWSMLGERARLSLSGRRAFALWRPKERRLAARRTRDGKFIRRMLELEDMAAREGGVGTELRMGASSRWTERANAAWWDELG